MSKGGNNVKSAAADTGVDVITVTEKVSKFGQETVAKKY